MKSKSSSVLTNTMLSQLEENEYLRVKLIQLEQVSRQKDNFYLSIFSQQQKVTQKVMSQLLFAQDKIKELIRSRICHNWKQQYDALADSVGSYVKDVNQLIQTYTKAKQALQEKALNKNDLYQYYSNTLDQCGKKFDQAEVIIEQLNSQIMDYKETICQMDEHFDQKLRIIQQQEQLIQDQQTQMQVLKHELQQNVQYQSHLQSQSKKQIHQLEAKIQNMGRTTKKLQKSISSYQNSNIQMSKIIQQLNKQIEGHKDKSQKSQKQNQKFEKMQSQNALKDKQIQQLKKEAIDNQSELQNCKQEIITMKEHQRNIFKNNKQQMTFVSMFNQEAKDMQIKKDQTMRKDQLLKNDQSPRNDTNIKNPMVQSVRDLTVHSRDFSFSENQLHLRKILQQDQAIKNLHSQAHYCQKTIQQLENENSKLIEMQRQLISRQSIFKKQSQEVNALLQNRDSQLQNLNEQIYKLKFEDQNMKAQVQQWKLQVQGLYDQISNFQAQKKQSKKGFQNLLQEFQQFVRETEFQKQNKKALSSIDPFQKDKNHAENKKTTRQIQKKENSQKQKIKFQQKGFSEMKKRLNLNLDHIQTSYDPYQLKEKTPHHDNMVVKNDFQHKFEDDNLNKTVNRGTKKFNLQNFQQKTNSHVNVCCSPKVGDIFNYTHQGRKNIISRW